MRVLALLLAAAALGGCGLHPLYGGSSGSTVAATMRSIAVGPIQGQSGWLVRNKLIDRLGQPESGAAAYRLDVTLDDNITAFGLRSDRAATQERRTLRARYQLEVEADLCPEPDLPLAGKEALYRIAQEALHNTVKHAHATRAWVRVGHDGAALHLVVGDDGRGSADQSGSGLAGVARRLAAFDGTLMVDSPPGGPTVVTMEVPCRTTS